MSIKNKVQLVGHVGQAPEVKSFGSDGKFVKFSIATNENYKNKAGEWVENTTWHNIVAWRNIGERVEKQVHKGSFIMVEGKIVNRDYEDKDGIKRYISEIDIRSFLVLDKKNKGNNTENYSAENNTKDFYKTAVEDDGLPF